VRSLETTQDHSAAIVRTDEDTLRIDGIVVWKWARVIMGAQQYTAFQFWTDSHDDIAHGHWISIQRMTNFKVLGFYFRPNDSKCSIK
jgi:hypothetical protein